MVCTQNTSLLFARVLAGVEQFGQDDDLRALLCGLADQALGGLKIAIEVKRGGEELDGGGAHEGDCTPDSF